MLYSSLNQNAQQTGRYLQVRIFSLSVSGEGMWVLHIRIQT